MGEPTKLEAASDAAPAKRRPPRAGMGRPAGVPNKVTRAAREAFQMAFDDMGGVDALKTWAQTNETEFYKLFARLIPVQQEHSGTGGGPLVVTWQPPEG